MVVSVETGESQGVIGRIDERSTGVCGFSFSTRPRVLVGGADGASWEMHDGSIMEGETGEARGVIEEN